MPAARRFAPPPRSRWRAAPDAARRAPARAPATAARAPENRIAPHPGSGPRSACPRRSVRPDAVARANPWGPARWEDRALPATRHSDAVDKSLAGSRLLCAPAASRSRLRSPCWAALARGCCPRAASRPKAAAAPPRSDHKNRARGCHRGAPARRRWSSDQRPPSPSCRDSHSWYRSSRPVG
ncbi:hypothetical protein D3C72_637990 [compost metagenome]